VISKIITSSTFRRSIARTASIMEPLLRSSTKARGLTKPVSPYSNVQIVRFFNPIASRPATRQPA
jgi:hypothetical protein